MNLLLYNYTGSEIFNLDMVNETIKYDLVWKNDNAKLNLY